MKKKNKESEINGELLGKCVDCEKQIIKSDFKNSREMKIFSINGTCPKCQKKTKMVEVVDDEYVKEIEDFDVEDSIENL